MIVSTNPAVYSRVERNRKIKDRKQESKYIRTKTTTLNGIRDENAVNERKFGKCTSTLRIRK